MSGTAFKPALNLLLISALCSLSVAAASGAVADDVIGREVLGKEIEIEHPSAGRPSVSRPAAGELPRALRIEVSDDGSVSAEGMDRAIETRAAVAAHEWSYRQGYHEGFEAEREVGR